MNDELRPSIDILLAAAAAAARAGDHTRAAALLRSARKVDPSRAVTESAQLYGNTDDWVWAGPAAEPACPSPTFETSTGARPSPRRS